MEDPHRPRPRPPRCQRRRHRPRQNLTHTATARPAATVDTLDLAVSLGLGHSLAANSPLARTVARLERYGAAQRNGDTLAVRTALPDLPARHLARLSASARLAHHHLAVTRTPEPEAPAVGQAVGL